MQQAVCNKKVVRLARSANSGIELQAQLETAEMVKEASCFLHQAKKESKKIRTASKTGIESKAALNSAEQAERRSDRSKASSENFERNFRKLTKADFSMYSRELR
jgi:hypothetical protein